MATKQDLADRANKANWEIQGTEIVVTDIGPPEVTEERVTAVNRVTREKFVGTLAAFNAVFAVPVPSDDRLRVHYNADGTPATVKDAAGNVVFTYGG